MDQKSSAKMVVYEQEGVFIHFCIPGSDDDKMLGGILTIFKDDEHCYLQWKPYDNIVTPPPAEHEAQVLSVSSSAVVGEDKQLDSSAFNHEITSEMRLPTPEVALDPDWTMVAKDAKKESSTDESFDLSMDVLSAESQESNSPQYTFTIPLEDIRCIKKSKKGVAWAYLLLELADGASLPTLHFHQGGSKKFWKVLERYVTTTKSLRQENTIEITPLNQNALTQSFDQLNLFGDSSFPTLGGKFLENPLTSTFNQFSKVTNFLQDFLNPAETTPLTRPTNERASLIDDATEAVGSSRIQFKQEGEGSAGFEVITCAELGPRLHPQRGKPISPEYWTSHKDSEGRITEVEQIKKDIFRGGVDPSLRKEVWKYLLGYYKWEMTSCEISELRRNKEEDYYRMKLQWKSVTPDQETRFTPLRENKSLIDKDVTRTDRTRTFYEGKENVSLKLLNDVLVTYCMYNFDLGYVQGMSDLLSPILELMGNEVDAFWCFVGYMDIVQHNFDVNQNGMKAQLRDLRTLIQFLDPTFFDNLIEKDSKNLYFCFRWLLLRFKREFSFENIQTLWEVIWTGLPCDNFHLLICVALLDTEKPVLMDKDCGFTDILKHVNGLSGKIDLQLTLSKAEGIYLQLATCQRDLSDTVRDVVGLSKQTKRKQENEN
ncbi:TBC1 domain family member 15-like [Clavelina lepadiformis]|uniref:TBC1 domain family member 15-like n=1 Tax=Clavelina lepadiformis TaxID=159417 RepID=UPI0040433524